MNKTTGRTPKRHLWIWRTTKLVPTTQMTSEDRRMHQLPQDRGTSRECAAAKQTMQENKELITSKRQTAKKKKVNRKKSNKQPKSTKYYQKK